MDVTSASDHLREIITDAPVQGDPSSGIAPRSSVDGHEIVDASQVPLQGDREAIVDAVQRIAANVSKHAELRATRKITEVMDHADKAHDPDGTWRDVPDQNTIHEQLGIVAFDFLTSLDSFYAHATAQGVDATLINVSKTYAAKCNDAYQKGDIALTLSWQDVVATSQRAIDASIKKNEAPNGSSLERDWRNVARTNQKLATIKVDLIEADATGNKTEVDRLTMLMKDGESIADLRFQIADAEKKGDFSLKDDLIRSNILWRDHDEIFSVIENMRSQKNAIRPISGFPGLFGKTPVKEAPAAQQWQKAIELCGKIVQWQKKNISAAAQNRLSPEMSLEISNVEQCYRKASRCHAVAAAVLNGSVGGFTAMTNNDNADRAEKVAGCWIKVADYGKRIIEAMRFGRHSEQLQCKEIARKYEQAAQIGMEIVDHMQVNAALPVEIWKRSLDFNKATWAANELAHLFETFAT